MHAPIWHADIQGGCRRNLAGYLLLWNHRTESGSNATEVGHLVVSLLRGLFWCSWSYLCGGTHCIRSFASGSKLVLAGGVLCTCTAALSSQMKSQRLD